MTVPFDKKLQHTQPLYNFKKRRTWKKFKDALAIKI